MATPYGTDFNRLGLDSWLEDSIRQKQAEEEEQKRAEATMALRRQGERRIPVGAMGMNLGSLPSVESVGRGIGGIANAALDASPFGFLNDEAPTPSTPPRPPGYIDPNAHDFRQQARKSFDAAALLRGQQPSAGGSEPQGETYQGPYRDAASRAKDLSEIEEAYRSQQEKEHPPLGFSWGGGHTWDWRPGDSTRSGQYGEAPMQGQGFEQTWNMPAKGGALSQSDIEKIPIGQRPASWFEDQVSGLDVAKINAERKRAEAEAEDPYAKERITADGRLREHAFDAEQGERRRQQFMDQMARYAIAKREMLDKIEKRADLDPVAKERARAEVEAFISEQEGAARMAFTGKEPAKGL